MNKKIYLSIVALSLLAIGTHKDLLIEPTVAAEAPPATQVMPVETITVKPEKLRLWKNFSGHIVAVDKADIRPQVSGRVMQILFKDGEYVKKGKVLMVIDPRPYEASVKQAQAEVSSAKTVANLAQKEFERAKNLITKEAIAQSLYDQRLNAKISSDATVKQAEAKLALAQVNLDYAYVKAPISGKIGRAEITVGNLVAPNANIILTSIVSDGNVYVDFEVDENTYLHTIQSSYGKMENIPVRLKVGEKDIVGKIHSFDNQIDAKSGTIRARAILPNEDGFLLSGMSVSVSMGEESADEKIFVPQAAIGTDQDRKFVYLIKDGKTSYQEVQLGETIDGKRVISSGVKSGDVVITNGIVKIRPNMPVVAK